MFRTNKFLWLMIALFVMAFSMPVSAATDSERSKKADADRVVIELQTKQDGQGNKKPGDATIQTIEQLTHCYMSLGGVNGSLGSTFIADVDVEVWCNENYWASGSTTCALTDPYGSNVASWTLPLPAAEKTWTWGPVAYFVLWTGNYKWSCNNTAVFADGSLKWGSGTATFYVGLQ
jgi:hypothetical protein